MNKYQKELQELKPWDKVQTFSFHDIDKGYPFIETAGHGYLVVQKNDKYKELAKKHATFTGEYAFYLEEDCDRTKFLEFLESI